LQNFSLKHEPDVLTYTTGRVSPDVNPLKKVIPGGYEILVNTPVENLTVLMNQDKNCLPTGKILIACRDYLFPEIISKRL